MVEKIRVATEDCILLNILFFEYLFIFFKKINRHVQFKAKNLPKLFSLQAFGLLISMQLIPLNVTFFSFCKCNYLIKQTLTYSIIYFFFYQRKALSKVIQIRIFASQYLFIRKYNIFIIIRFFFSLKVRNFYLLLARIFLIILGEFKNILSL